MFKRILVIVLDGVGIGALPDAGAFGDADAATLPHVAEAVGGLNLPHLEQLGLGRIVQIKGVRPLARPAACWGKMAEKSAGKDSVTGHWELAGVVLEHGFATYPEGFPEDIIQAFTAVAGTAPLGNVAASGTQIIRDLGEEHLRSGRPIVYTSTDSVFQIAAHERIMKAEDLYHLCRKTFEALKPYNICRVIARPFAGADAGTFYRTSGRHDYSQQPPQPTLLERLQQAGITTCGIGKIGDLFAGKGLTRSLSTADNGAGMEQTLKVLEEMATGLIMTNLVDFDMVYGHRCDPSGFAAALQDFDAWLPLLLHRLQPDDLLMITADHGCDPTTDGTDHTREYVPLLVFSPGMKGSVDLGRRSSFSDLAATIAENFDMLHVAGKSFLPQLRALCNAAAGPVDQQTKGQG